MLKATLHMASLDPEFVEVLEEFRASPSPMQPRAA